MGILKYSNGRGHLIMSVVAMGVGVYLIVAGYGTIGTSLIATVSAAWFIPGAAKQVAYSVVGVTSTAVKTAATTSVQGAASTPGPGPVTSPPVAG